MAQSNRKVWLSGVLVALVLVATAGGQSGVVLSPVVAPGAAQPAVHTVAVTGSGFPAGTIPAANVAVTLTPASGTGTSATVTPQAVQLLFAGTQRLAFQVPTSIAVSTPTSYRIAIVGTTSTGTAFQSTAPVTFTINPPAQIVSLAPASAGRGATTSIQIATQYTDFAAGVTRANFGPDASVGGGPVGGFGPVAVTGPTTATAVVTLGPTAATGARTVTVATGVQTAALAGGLMVLDTAPANQAPHITSAPGTAVTALQAYAYQATATDGDGDPLTWALTQAPSGMTIAPATGAVAWTPAASLAGTHPVTVQVIDGKGGLDTQSFSITVAAAHVNQAPKITTTAGTSATVGQAYSYTPAATDADGDTLIWALTQSPNLMTINPASGVIAWTPTNGQVGAQIVTVSVTDGHGGTDSQTFAITVSRPPNQAPHITSTAVTTGRATAAYAYTVTATDPDGDPLTFALTTAPAGMSIDRATGAIAWTPTAGQIGSQAVAVRVTDGRGGTDTQSFTIAVGSATNTAPTARITGPTTGTMSESLAFDASTSTDPDNDPLTFTWAFGDGATATGATASHSYAASGSFNVQLTVDDGRGHSASVTRTVTVGVPSNRPPVAVIGGPYLGEVGVPVVFSGTGSSDPDGDALVFAWSFGDQGTGTGATPSHSYTSTGTYTVTLTVTDSHQATSNSATTSVTITAPVDRAPPLVALMAPTQALPGATVTITVSASDNASVSSVVLNIEGEAPTTFTAAPYSRTYTLPAVAAPGSVIHLSASAADPSSNIGQATATITVAAEPDTQPPTATLTAPPQAAPGTTVTLSADAHDNVGVAGVAFTVDGAPIGTVATPPYVTTWTVPSSATAGTVYALTATASDAGGLTGAASSSLTVVAIATGSADPSVTLTVPAIVPAGGTVDLSAVPVADPNVASVAFRVDGATLATVVTPPYATRYTVPAGLRNGATLQVQAEVTDGLGRTARDTKTTTVQASAAPGMGVMYGRVFDDTTGLAIAGATVSLVSTSISATTDAQGRYTISASEGPGTLRITKAGWSRADRPVTFVVGSLAFRVLDARLTPLAAVGAATSAVMGGTVNQSGWSLVVPGGSLAADTALALTTIGGQGLQGRLPLGWAPVATVDVTPHGLAFAPAATLKAPAQTSSATLVLARWDETASAWRAVTTLTSATLQAPIVSTGQYAWLRADTVPAVPAMPADGALLEGVTAVPIPETATTTVSPDPKILFYSPGVGSTVTGLITSSSPLPSGAPLTLALNEVYHFLDGTNASPERVTQDLVAYQASRAGVPPAGGVPPAEAVFPATPSLTFEAIALRDGVITVALHVPGAETGVPLLGATGGVVNGPAGEQLEIPPGAAPAAPMSLDTLAQADAGLTLPADTTWLAGVTFSFAGDLALPARLSVPRPAGLADVSQVLLARVRESNGQTQFLLVARARLDGDRLVADTTLPGSSEVLEGVVKPGRYVFLQAASPLAFTAGLVSGVAGAPFAGALVTNDRLGVGALSSSAGRYAQAMPGGAVALTALDETKRDAGTSSGTVVAGLTGTINLALFAQPPSVLSVTPVEGATNVALSDPVVVRFSEPLLPATVTALAVLLTGPSGPITSSLALTSNNTVVTLRPASPLDANTVYTVTIDNTITDLAGYPLPAEVTAHFTSLDTTAPPAPSAGNLSATIPSNGTTTVSGTQGSAGLHDTVTIVNVTQKTTTPALVNPDGSFSAIVAAAKTDELKIDITDPSGNTTTVSLPAFRQVNPDGSISQVIGKTGGHMEGPAGIAIDVTPGTFPTGAVVTLKPATEDQFPALTPEQAAVFSFSGGLSIDFGGATPEHYVNASVPAGPLDTVDDQWVLGRLVDIDGVPSIESVDTARIIAGKIATSSPPCPGILESGQYIYRKSAQPLGVVYGSFDGASLNATSLNQSLRMPYGVYGSNHAGFCIPVLTGQYTLVVNTMTLSFPSTELKAGDASVYVENATPGFENHWYFGRAALVYEWQAPAGGGTWTATAIGPSITAPVVIVPLSVVTEGSVTRLRVRVVDVPQTADQVIFTPAGGTAVPVNKVDLRVAMTVSGGQGHVYNVYAANAGFRRPLAGVRIDAPPAGPKPLLFRAQPGTVSLPDTVSIKLRRTGGADQDVDLAKVVDGGFAVSMDGLPSQQFWAVLVVRKNGVVQPEQSIPITTIRIVVTDASGQVVPIEIPAPPKNQPFNLGPISSDRDPSHHPTLVTPVTRYDGFDPSDLLQFTFDVPVSGILHVETTGGLLVLGETRQSNSGKTLTFVPDVALQPAQTYRVSLAAILDAGGHAPDPVDIPLTTIGPRPAGTPFSYRLISSGVLPNDGFVDIQLLPTTSGGPETHIVALTGSGDGGTAKLVTLDVRDPDNLLAAASKSEGYYKQRVTVVPGITALPFRLSDFTACGPPPFTGTLAVTTFTNAYSGTWVQFYDVTKPGAPCLLGGKVLAVMPEHVTGQTELGTVRAFGVANRAVVLGSPGVYTAYVAVAGIGLMSVSLRDNIPDVRPELRQREPFLPGDYVDVATAAGRLLALNQTDGQIEVVDPNLAVLHTLPLPVSGSETGIRLLVYKEGVPWDENGDGTLAAGEYANLAVVAAGHTVFVVDATDLQALRVVSKVKVGSFISDLDFDPRHRWAWITTGSKVLLIDFSSRPDTSSVDNDGDGIDDRLVWSTTMPGSLYTVAVGRGTTVYVGGTDGIARLTLEPKNVHGTARYTFFPATKTGIDYTYPADKRLRPIRGARVVLWDQNANKKLDEVTTDEYGRYSFFAPPGSRVRVRILSQFGLPGTDITVRNNYKDNLQLDTKPHKCYADSGEPYTWISDTIDVVPDGNTVDLDVITTWNSGTNSYTDRDAAPFAVLDSLYTAVRTLRGASDSGLTFPTLNVFWSPNNIPAATPAGDDADFPNGLIGGAHYNNGTGSIYLSGRAGTDTDEYDRAVIDHEFGHYLVAKFSRDDSPGGSHSSKKEDPRLSYSEGMATALATLLAGQSLYADTSGTRQQNVLAIDMEEHSCYAAVAPATAKCIPAGWWSEDAIYQFFWDLADPKSAAEPRLPGAGAGTFEDRVELSVPMFFQALRRLKDTPATTTLYSFFSALYADPNVAPEWFEVQRLASEFNIPVPADPSDPFNGPFYTEVPVQPHLATPVWTERHADGGAYDGQLLATRDVDGFTTELNNIYNVLFFKFDAPRAGTYVVHAEPVPYPPAWWGAVGVGEMSPRWSGLNYPPATTPTEYTITVASSGKHGFRILTTNPGGVRLWVEIR
jgi:PKD repeat protein